MTPERLTAIKERLADATPGPWGWSGCANDRVDVCSEAEGWEGAEIAVVTKDYEFNNRDGLVDGMPVMDRAMAHANGALIMHAPSDLRELVAEVERLQGHRDGLIAIMRATGLQVREWERDGQQWLTVLPAGCACQESIGDAPCPLHKPEESDADH